MKLKKLLVIPVVFFASTSTYGDNDDVRVFAESLKQYILSEDKDSIVKLNCYPSSFKCVEEGAIERIFGKKYGEGVIEKVVKSPNIKIKIFGPFTYERQHPNSSFSIVYFNPDLVKFNKKGLMDEQVMKDQWDKGYVETVVTKIKGRIYLNRTIFYYGAHIPWVGDYG
jgi:hypothetical protein